jgi:hypothetical protein
VFLVRTVLDDLVFHGASLILLTAVCQLLFGPSFDVAPANRAFRQHC